MGRSPVQGGIAFQEIAGSRSQMKTVAVVELRVLAADPDEHAGEQTDEPDRQKHQVVAQPAGLDRTAPVAGHIDGLGRQVDQAVDGDHVEDPLEPAQ